MRFYLKTLLVLFLAVAGPVHAEEEDSGTKDEVLSGQELLDGCEEGAAPGAPNQYCMRYVFGLVQMLDTLQQAEPSQKIFCINPNVISLQVVTERMTNWLKGVPHRLNEDAYKLVTEALHSSYPCSSQNI
ncbi:MAG: hypothetical protein A2W69_02465 [Gammaproteobacteria bacterium RIFCSPLOWO2_02_47_7]|jgi:hypothetical protein|nr:MAG: hypothetical protein A2W69_02465 [Gammaproteobacteria bacterium RIFCSPLOWO2_02_47_7]